MKLIGWFAAFLISFSISLSSHAQTSEFSKWKASELYRYGAGLVKKGRTLEKAIEALREATKKEPSNAEYHTALACALACALASRFQSVSMAVEKQPVYTNLIATYAFKKKAWDAAQMDPMNPYFGIEEPKQPIKSTTLDDDKPFDISKTESSQLRMKLGIEAIEAFKTAQLCSADKDNELQAETAYTHGWGLLLLRISGKDIVKDKPLSDASKGVAAP